MVPLANMVHTFTSKIYSDIGDKREGDKIFQKWENHFVEFSYGLTFRQYLYTTIPNPLRPPQRTNFHDAPCHRPPINIVNIKFIFALICLPTALYRIAKTPNTSTTKATTAVTMGSPKANTTQLTTH